YTIANEWLDVPEEIAALPYLQGYGNVYDLQQAMVRDTSGQLKSLVEQFMAASDTGARNGLMEQILYKWTGSESVDPNSRGQFIDARRLAVLEKLFGENWNQAGITNPAIAPAAVLDQSFKGVFEMYYAQLMSQTHMQDLYGMITYTWDETAQSVKGDLNAVTSELQNRLTLDYESGKTDLGEFVRSLRGFQAEDMMNFSILRYTFASQGEELSWIVDSSGKNMFIGTSGNDSLSGDNYAADALKGNEGNDTLNGNSGNDTLYGDEGDDVLNGGSDSDILKGGEGNDILNGGTGNDTYIFGRGDGQDTLTDYDTAAGNVDTVEFEEGITRADVDFIAEGNNLRVRIKDTGDSLLIQNWFYVSSGSYNYRVEQFRFEDGSIVTDSDIEAEGFKVYGTAGNETLNGTDYTDFMYGLDGNDTLNGGAGDDTLDGGAGSDTLNGGAGNDTYLFGIGSGVDSISDLDTTVGNVDTVEFGAGITVENLEFAKEGSYDLRIKIIGTSESLKISNWFNVNYSKNIEQFKFADGTIINGADIGVAIPYTTRGTVNNDTLIGSSERDILYGDAANDTLTGNAGNDILYGDAGIDTLNGNDGDDVLYGGDGNDTLNGGAGDDTLDGGAGSDTLNGGAGNDTYLFGIGSGVDSISNYDTEAGITDTVAFGVNPLDLIFSRIGNNLDIAIYNNTDHVAVQNWYSNANYQTEVFHSADGNHLQNNQVDQLIQAMATFCTNNGLSTWNQALQDRPQDVQQIITQYWSQQ
ncbi:MAG: calcium-binding protein, partial [Nitrospirota bacterium]